LEKGEKMKVAELMLLLSTFPEDHNVYVEGYEGGLEDVKSDRVNTVRVLRDGIGPDPYQGPHEHIYIREDSHNDVGVLIGR
jgi:hypothetical protein